MTRASTRGANTSVSVVCMAIPGKTFWRTSSQSARESARQLFEWRCQKKVRTSSPSRITISSCQPHTSSMLTLRLLPPKFRDPSLTPQRATLGRHSSTRLAVTATSWCAVMARQKCQSNTGVQMQQSISYKHCRRKRIRSRGVLANPKAMRMTQEDWRAYNTATICHVCEKLLDGVSVRDHCHITGQFRGAAHNTCYLKLRLNPKTTTIPVVFHNLRGYDSHLLMQAISKVEGQVICIPKNTEKYISFSLGQLCFIDSAQFLLASLDKMVSANKPEAFQITTQHEPDEARRSLLMRKGVYPYEFMDSWERFAEPRLSPKGGLLLQANRWGHQRRGLHPCAKSLGDLWVRLSGGLQWPLLQDMFCCWPMSSRTFGRPAWGNMVWTRRTISPAPAYLGMPSSRRPE